MKRHFTTPLDRTQGLGNENNLAFFSCITKAKITFSSVCHVTKVLKTLRGENCYLELRKLGSVCQVCFSRQISIIYFRTYASANNIAYPER